MAVTLDDLDRSRALRTPAELRELVEAIRDSPPDSQETNWVEWKSSLDLSSKEGRFSIARAVLGFANRDVKVAGRAFEGVAYMVVGAEPGAVAGVTMIDHAALEQGIRTYLDGPRWAPHYVQVDGKNVLVVVIEAPREGDTIHTLLKEFTPDDKSESSGERVSRRTVNRAGTIYHRGTARTEQAAPAEIEMLVQRAVDGFRDPALELDVSMSASRLVRLDTRPAALTEWLEQHEQSVRAHSGQPRPPRPAAPRSPSRGIADMFRPPLGDRLGPGAVFREEDAKDFESQLSKYLVAKRAHLEKQLQGAMVRSDANKVRFVVHNNTGQSITGVQLTVRFPREGIVVRTIGPDAGYVPPEVPRWPSLVGREVLRRRVSGTSLPGMHQEQIVEVISTEVVEATFDIGDLRPDESETTTELTVLPSPTAPDTLELELTARAMDREGTKVTPETLPVSSELWGPGALVNARVKD